MISFFAGKGNLAVLFLMLAVLLVPGVVAAQDVLSMADDEQKDWLTSFVQERLSTPERQIRFSNIDGLLGSDVFVREITISDTDGVWLRINKASLNWNLAALFTGRLEVHSFRAESVQYLRKAVPSGNAVSLPDPEAAGFVVPQLPVAVILEELSIPSVTFGEDVFGLESAVSLNGELTLDSGNLDNRLRIERLDGSGGRLDLDIQYQRAENSIDLDLSLVEPENGVIANLLNIEDRPAMTLRVTGSGPVARLRTDISLLANGQQAVSGMARISQEAAGVAIAVDLRGVPATLMAEPYRPFFGAETTLRADALIRAEGGLTVSGIDLRGGQLSLRAALETTSDYFLSALALDAVIADANGRAVTLPVPGEVTQLGSAQVAIHFGGEASENWTARLVIADLATGGSGARQLMFSAGGVAANLSDPAMRRLTFNGDGSISGIYGSHNVVAAWGDVIGFGIAGLWNAGQPVHLAELRVAGETLTTVLSGQLDGLDFSGAVTVEAANIAPFSDLVGRDLKGGISLKVTGSISPLSGGFDLLVDGTGRNLGLGGAIAEGVLAGRADLSGRLVRNRTGFAAEAFRLVSDQIDFTADGTYSKGLTDFRFTLDLHDLHLLASRARGQLYVSGAAEGTTGDNLQLKINARVAEGSLSGRVLRDADISFDGRWQAFSLIGDLNGLAQFDGYRASLAAGLNVTEVMQTLSDVNFQVGETWLTGEINHVSQTGLLNGNLTLKSSDLSVPAALVLFDARGAINLDIGFSAPEGVQEVVLHGDVTGFETDTIHVGLADINASVVDLFGVPVVYGSAKASNVSVMGIDIASLNASASQSEDTTRFDAQAALTIGASLDVAGSLMPVDSGFRIGLDRMQLQQGRITGRLVQPTVIQMADDAVTLNSLRFDVGSGSITANGSAGEALSITFDIQALPLTVANAILPELGMAGTVNGQARISGTVHKPQVSFEVQADGVNAAVINAFGIAPVSATASGSFRDNVVRLSTLSVNGADGLVLRGSGSVPLVGNGLDIAVNGSAPLALGNFLLTERGGQLSGFASLDAHVGGSMNTPQFGGTVSISDAGYVDPELNLRLQGITGSARLDGDNLVVERLSASLATGGSVSVSGSVGLTGRFPADLRVGLDSARYADGTLFVATLSGDLAVTGDIIGNPLLSGQVHVQEAGITVPESFDGGIELIDVEHRRAPVPVLQTLARGRVDERPSEMPAPRSRPAGLLLDVMVDAPNQIFVRGRGLDAEVGGAVRITGPLDKLQPVGSFSLNRGRLSILGQRITFDTGAVTLLGDLDPALNFVARSEGKNVTVFVTVAGRVSNIKVTFSSNPTLPQDEVLSQLLFNRSMGELSPMQIVRLAGVAAELAGGSGSDLAEGIRDAAGLADLDLVTDQQGNATVQAGTYLQDNLYLGVQAGANGQSKVTINLDVTDTLKITGAAGQDGRSSLGIYYEQDY